MDAILLESHRDLNVRNGPSGLVKWLRRLAATLVVLTVATMGSVVLAQRFSDGPMGPLQGGSFQTGEVVSGPISDWSFINDSDGGLPEIELIGPGTSRITGLMLHDNELYIPCDLGFMGNRDYGSGRWMAQAILSVKRWHQDALEDGRLVIRLNGKRYGGTATRVTDPDLLMALRAQVEDMGRQFYGLEQLPDAPSKSPNDIWFFRVASRAI